jgi:hypothetical protein
MIILNLLTDYRELEKFGGKTTKRKTRKRRHNIRPMSEISKLPDDEKQRDQGAIPKLLRKEKEMEPVKDYKVLAKVIIKLGNGGKL